MTLEITLDEESEEITLLLDNHLLLSAYKDADTIAYSGNFSKIDDDAVYKVTKQICTLLLNL